MGFQAAPDRSQTSPLVPKDCAEVTVLDADGRPIPGIDVRLGILHQTIATGEKRESRTEKTGPDGKVLFKGLPGTDSSYSYRVSVTRGAATFAIPEAFQLDKQHGQQVILHVYEVVRDVAGAQLGMFGFMFVETRDDVFAFEVMFRVYNIGRTAWVPQNVSIGLPKGWKAFRATDSTADTRFEVQDEKVMLLGTFSPGQHEAVFSFNVPNPHKQEHSFSVRLPPRVGQMQVIAAAPRGMDLAVDGFDPARPIPARNGQRSLATIKRLRAGDTALESLTITLSGIPTRGYGSWIALALSLLTVAAGFAFAFTRQAAPPTAEAPDQLRQAQELIVEELVRLTQAYSRGDIGPRTYERAKQALIDATARLETQLLALQAKRSS